MKRAISIVLSICVLCSIYIAPPASAASIPEDFDVFYYDDFGDDVTYADGGGYATRLSGGTTTRKNGVLHCVVASGAKSSKRLEFTNAKLAEQDYMIADVVITPVKISENTNIMVFNSKNSAGTTWKGATRLEPNNQITFPNASTGSRVSLGTWTANTPVRISIAYNNINSTADTYINGEKVRSNVPTKSVKSDMFTIELMGYEGGTGLEFNIDNVMLYSGTKLRDADFVKSYTHNSVMDSEITARKSLGNAMAYTVESDYYYTDGEKKTYTADAQKPIFYNDGAYVSDEFLTQVLKISRSTSSSENAVTVNGKAYMPAEEAATAMGKKYLYDDRGYFIFSDDEFPYVTTDHFKDIYDKDDVIYRYLYYANPTGEQMLSAYNSNSTKGQYPRFLFTGDDVAYIKSQLASNSADWIKAYNTKATGGGSDTVLHMANTYCNTAFNNKSAYFSFIDEAHAPSNSKKHSNTTILVNAMENLAFAYHISGDTKYAKRAVEIMDLVTGWSSVEANGELTRGQWAMGLAMGYDSFHDYILSTTGGAAKLAGYRQRAIDLLLTDAAKGYRNQTATKWIIIADNFNGVVSSGVMGILIAMGEDLQKEYADYTYLLENVVKTMEIAVSLYHPDGGYYEGISYGDYNMANFTRTLNAMYNCFGTDYGLSNARGLDETSKFFTYLQTAKRTFNYHDSSQNVEESDMALTFTLRHGKLEDAAMLKRQTEQRGGNISAFPLLQYEKALKIYGKPDISDYPLDGYFDTIDTGTFRNTFDSTTPTFAGYHGGWTTLSHGMMDVGSFIFEANGVMWAHDLGGEGSYPSGYFSSNGYKYYRKRPEGENCVVINPKVDSATYFGQAFDTRSKLIRYETAARGGFSAFDLTDVYGRDVNKYHRGYYFGDGRRTYTIQDEMQLKGTSEVYWFMHTPATITINSPTSATLTSGSKKLNVEVYCSEEGYSLLDMDPAPLPSSPEPAGANSANTGRKLAIHCPEAKGDVTISVKLIPVSDTYTAEPLQVTSISRWTILEGEIGTSAIMSIPDVCNYKNAIATIQLPEDIRSAEFLVDGVTVDEFSIAPGAKDTVSIPVSNMAKGSHLAELKLVYSSGEEKTYSKRFDFVPLKNSVSFDNSLSDISNIEKSMWTLSASDDVAAGDGCLDAKVSGTNTESYIHLLADNAITGKITVECQVKCSSNTGQFIIMGYNGDDEEFGQTKYPLDSGKYEADRWYNLSIQVETLENLGYYTIFVDGEMATWKLSNNHVSTYKGTRILYRSLDDEEKTVSFRNLKVTYEDVVSYDNPLTELPKPEKSIWTLSTSDNVTAGDGSLEAQITGTDVEEYIYLSSAAAINGTITVECEVKCSSNNGQFIIIGYNGDDEEFGQTKYPLDSGKYEADRWYNLSMKIETGEKSGYYTIFVDGEEASAKTANTLLKHYNGAKILYRSLDDSEKTVSFRNLKVTFEDVFLEEVDLDTMSVHNTANVKVITKIDGVFPSKKATLVIASYDDKRMIDVIQHKDITLTVGEAIEKELKFSEDAKYIKAMIYDSEDMHTPICTSEYYYVK